MGESATARSAVKESFIETERQMINHYSPKTFLRQTSNSLLQQCFARQGALTDVDWGELPEHNVEVVYDK